MSKALIKKGVTIWVDKFKFVQTFTNDAEQLEYLKAVLNYVSEGVVPDNWEYANSEIMFQAHYNIYQKQRKGFVGYHKKPKDTPKAMSRRKPKAEPKSTDIVKVTNEIDGVKIDTKTIKKAWNNMCNNLPKSHKVSEQQKKKFLLRAKEVGLQGVKSVFLYANSNPFYNGTSSKHQNGDTKWTATLSWILEPRNFNRIYEQSGHNPDEVVKNIDIQKEMDLQKLADESFNN